MEIVLDDVRDEDIKNGTFEIPNGVTSIGGYAFYATGLASITISSSITDIDEFAFYNCGNLKDVYFNGTKEQWDKIYIDKSNKDLLNATIHFKE